jgi:hypothetical protein
MLKRSAIAISVDSFIRAQMLSAIQLVQQDRIAVPAPFFRRPSQLSAAHLKHDPRRTAPFPNGDVTTVSQVGSPNRRVRYPMPPANPKLLSRGLIGNRPADGFAGAGHHSKLAVKTQFQSPARKSGVSLQQIAPRQVVFASRRRCPAARTAAAPFRIGVNLIFVQLIHRKFLVNSDLRRVTWK